MDGWTVERRHQLHRQQFEKKKLEEQRACFTERSCSSLRSSQKYIYVHKENQVQKNLHVSTNVFQGQLTSIMSDSDWSGVSPPSPSLLSSELLKKKMESLSLEKRIATSSSTAAEGMVVSDNPDLLPNFRSLLNGSTSLGSTDLFTSASQGFAMRSATAKAIMAEKRQLFAAATSSSADTHMTASLQQSQSAHAEMMSKCENFDVSGEVGGESSQRIHPFLNSSSTNVGLFNMAASQSTKISAASSSGVTRSFSSSSGFPPSSSSLFSTGEKNGSTDSAFQSSAGDLVPALDSFVSPFKRAPFNFRNFNRPLWTDMRENRITLDPTLLMKQSASQIQFSASQQTILEASSNINGQFNSIRAFKDQRMMLRQSYGASESESDNDDDEDDDFGTIKSITYRPKAGLPYQQKLALTNKPHNYAPSEDDDVSIAAPSEADTESTTASIRQSGVTIEELPVTPEHKKCYKVAHELLTTERTYVKILHLIDQVFHFRVDQENRVQTMFPPEIITQIFCNIKSLYQLHHDHLLPQLEKRLANWDNDPRIGDIMKDFAPFLKMYSEYVQNFDNAINLINLYREKNVRFMNIINEIQKMEQCGNLPIQHHLIGPIQRIPRYRLLLEAYLRRLPEDSEDRPDTEKALQIVSKAAEHANEGMRRVACFKKLLEVQENVKGVVDLVSPTRTLIKEGKISKISARTGDHQERYVFLFNDVILLCSMRPMANRMISNAPYQLRARLDVASVTVAEGDDLEVVNTFYVEDSHRKIELYTSTAQEKEEWMTAIHNAKEELVERKSSLRLGSISPTEDELGLKEPTKLKTDNVSKCMECYTSFTMLKRRHHCHACGCVVCAKCADTKVPLPYAGGKPCRVCKRCKTVLTQKAGQNKKGDETTSIADEPVEKLRGVLDVPASIPAVLSANLSLRLRGRKEWTVRWFALRSDFVLYCYETDSDQRAMTATPIPGMSVAMIEDLSKAEAPSVASSEKDRVFRLAHGHGRKSFVFLAATRSDALNWVHHLKQAAKAELPSASNNNNASSSPIKSSVQSHT